jgi:hypothetical protein
VADIQQLLYIGPRLSNLSGLRTRFLTEVGAESWQVEFVVRVLAQAASYGKPCKANAVTTKNANFRESSGTFQMRSG